MSDERLATVEAYCTRLEEALRDVVAAVDPVITRVEILERLVPVVKRLDQRCTGLEEARVR